MRGETIARQPNFIISLIHRHLSDFHKYNLNNDCTHVRIILMLYVFNSEDKIIIDMLIFSYKTVGSST